MARNEVVPCFGKTFCVCSIEEQTQSYTAQIQRWELGYPQPLERPLHIKGGRAHRLIRFGVFTWIQPEIQHITATTCRASTNLPLYEFCGDLD